MLQDTFILVWIVNEMIGKRMRLRQEGGIDHFLFVSLARCLPVDVCLGYQSVTSQLQPPWRVCRLFQIPYDQTWQHIWHQEMFLSHLSWYDRVPSSLAPRWPLCYFNACHLRAAAPHSPRRASPLLLASFRLFVNGRSTSDGCTEGPYSPQLNFYKFSICWGAAEVSVHP